jgi:hypothetical protein
LDNLGSIGETSRDGSTALIKSVGLVGNTIRVNASQQLVAVVVLNLEKSGIISLDLDGEVVSSIVKASNAASGVDARLLSRSQHGASQDYDTDEGLVELGVNGGAKEIYRHGLTRLLFRSVLLDRRDMRTHYFYRIKY